MTGAELYKAWDERDRRYSVRKGISGYIALSEAEIDAVKSWRRKEIDLLPPDERSTAWGVFHRWEPPLTINR